MDKWHSMKWKELIVIMTGIYNLIDFYKTSYSTDKTAFYVELTETAIMIVVVVLTFSKVQEFGPVAYFLVPAYLMSSMLSVFSAIRRNSGKLLLYSVFVIFNTATFIKLFV